MPHLSPFAQTRYHDACIMRIIFTYPTYAISLLLLIAAALHYPLATTFPIGGDAASYIRDSQKLLSALGKPSELISPDTYSRYPLTQAAFAFLAVLPVHWTERYTWFMTLAFISAGISLSLLANRLGGPPAAATAAAAWATTLVTIQPHIEDGTMAQLLSLSALFLFLERLSVSSYGLASFFLVAALLAHPITGIVGLLIAYVAIITQTRPTPRFVASFLVPVAVTTVLAIASLFDQHSFFNHVPSQDRTVSFLDNIRSWIAPAWILAPVGLITLSQRFKRHAAGTSAIMAFAYLAFLLTFNDLLGISVWTFRFSTYLISAILLLFSIALPQLLTLAIPYKSLRYALATLLVLSIYLPGWTAATAVFAHNESPSKYARIHRDELAALKWMDENLPPQSTILSTQENRHSEWIPILTRHQWQGVHGTIPEHLLQDGQFTHVIYLKKREGVPQHVRDNFSVVHETDAAAIFKL